MKFIRFMVLLQVAIFILIGATTSHDRAMRKAANTIQPETMPGAVVPVGADYILARR